MAKNRKRKKKNNKKKTNKKKANNKKTLRFSFALSCILYSFFLGHLHNYFFYFNNFISSTVVSFFSLIVKKPSSNLCITFLWLDVGLFFLFSVLGKYIKSVFKPIYVIWGVSSIILVLCSPFFYNHGFSFVIFLYFTTCLIYAITKLITKILQWILNDKKTRLAKITFIWGVIVTIFGYILKGSLK